MKALILALVLANLGFWAWASWVADEPGASLPATPEPAVTQLKLIERERPVAVDEPAEVVVASATDDRATAAEPVPQEPEPASSEATDDQEFADADAQPGAAKPAQASVAETPASAPPASTANKELDVTELPVLEQITDAVVAEKPAVPDQIVPVEILDALDTPRGDTTVAMAAIAGPDYERCATLGPFLNLRQASAAARKLRAQEISPSQRPEEDQVWVGHWVHLPPYPTREAAILVVEQLRGDGVTDIYIEPSGDMQHAVSLGLFSDAARAETRAGEIRTLGVRPQIRDRHRTDLVHWLDFRLAPGVVLDPADFSPRPDQVIRLTERECAE